MSKISEAMEKARREKSKPAEEAPMAAEGRRSGFAYPEWALPSDVTEQYQGLAAEVCLALPNLESRVIVFASAANQEGTSMVAREFAVTLAGDADADTVLVDANLRRPTLDEAFRIPRDPGLSDHVLGDVALSDCLTASRIPRLSLLPAGRRVVAPPHVLADARVGAMLVELRRQFGYVVVDVPAVLQFADGIQISRLVDGVVVVIRSGRTKREQVERAIGLLSEAGAKVLGTVLNRRRFHVPRFIYERL